MQSIPFDAIKNAVLGKRYELSVALIAPAAMRRAMKYKKVSTGKVSNVLSFPLSSTSGEILICKEVAKKEAPLYRLSHRDMVAYLFIHGLFHLKGRKHGATMEHEESRVMKRFGFGSNG